MSSNHTKIDHIVDEEKKKKKEEHISVPSKEGEPIRKVESSSVEHFDIAESEPHIEDQELQKFIKVEKDDFELDPSLRKAGLQVIDSSSLDPRHKVKLSISDEKIVEGLEQPINSSWRWLAEFSRFLLKTAHISLKKIHGHVVRVIKK